MGVTIATLQADGNPFGGKFGLRIKEMNRRAKEMYEQLARMPVLGTGWIPILFFLNFIFTAISGGRWENFFIPSKMLEFWEYPLTQEVFEKWRDNIGGFKTDVAAQGRERNAFLQNFFEMNKIAHDPVYAKEYENWRESTFFLKLMRFNTHANIYIHFNFEMRTLRAKVMPEYFKIAAKTGDMEIFLKRFPPYHQILRLDAKRGERAFLDSRDMDWPPLTYRLDMRYSAGLKLSRIQTRQNDRTISLEPVLDMGKEQERMADIQKRQEDKDALFKGIKFFGPVPPFKFGDDGNLYTLDGKPLFGLGFKRSQAFHLTSEISMLKGTRHYADNSSIVVEFNLMDNFEILIRGMDREKEISLDEVIALIKCVDLMKPNPNADFGQDMKTLAGIVEKVFEKEYPDGLNINTLRSLRKIEEIRKEDGHDEGAWQYLIQKFKEQGFGQVQSIINKCMTGMGFDLVFNLLPLIQGKEFSVPDEVDFPYNPPKSTVLSKYKLQELPLVEILKSELELMLSKIYSKYLDISAATIYDRNDARLSKALIEYLMTGKVEPVDDVREFNTRHRNRSLEQEEFRQWLTEYLTRRYRIHTSFLKEIFIITYEPNAEVLSMQSIFDSTMTEEKIRSDVNGIMNILEETRLRLYDTDISHRLLCFIDPDSVSVRIGEFHYHGDMIEKELHYLRSFLEMENHAALDEAAKRRALTLIRKKARYGAPILETEEKIHHKHIWLEKEKIQGELDKMEKQLELKYKQVHLAEITDLERGNYFNFMALRFMNGYIRGGKDVVRDCFQDMEYVLRRTDPEKYKQVDTLEVKRKFVDGFDKLQGVNYHTIGAMLSNEVDMKEITKLDIFNDIQGLLSTAVHSLGLARFFPLKGIDHNLLPGGSGGAGGKGHQAGAGPQGTGAGGAGSSGQSTGNDPPGDTD